MKQLKRICPKCLAALTGRACSCGFVTAPNCDYAMALPNYVLLQNRYLLLRVIGAGGFGVTYKAMDLSQKRLCAIKEYVPVGVAIRTEDGRMTPETAAKAGIYSHAKQRFLEEAYILQKLNSMPNTVTVRDCFEENETAYFVMDFISGSTVKAEVVKAGRLPLALALRVVRSVGETLHRIHTEAKIFHRDISPENIMLTEDGQVKLLDFGSAKIMAKQGDQNFTVVLKGGYAPPEQYSSVTPQGAFTDVYALASTFYYMVSGVKIPAAPARIDGARYTPLCVQNPEVPESASAAIDRALLLNRRERTQTCGQLLQELPGGRQQVMPRPVQPVRPVNPAQPRPPVPAPVRPVSPAAPAAGALAAVSHGQGTQLHALRAGVIYQVGRSPACDLVLPQNNSLSNLHLYLYFDAARKVFAVKNVSRNGVAVGRAALQKGRFYLLPPGSVLRLAGGACGIRLLLPEKNV